VLELAILGLLKERSMHGYQLSKRLRETLGGFWSVSYGSLYPALKRLQKAGAVEPVFAKEDVGRRKNVYRITDTGERMFAELLEETGHESWEDNPFRVRLAFFQYLKPETRLRLLEKRRAFLEGRLFEIKASLKNARERIDAYTLSLMRHGAESTAQDIAWLDGLIETERRQVRTAAVKPAKAARVPRVRRDGPRPERATRRRPGSTVPAKETTR
jgi:DNA-binding PadR family transcriptional regulator